MVCPSESSGWLRFPRSCFCCVNHLRVSSSCTSCSRGACFRKTAGARKPRRVAACRLHSDRFRWAKHEILVMMTVYHRWTAASSDMLRKAFLSLMVLCHRSHQSKLSWDQELFSRSVCYDVVKRRWFWADATILQEQTAHIPCTKACYRAARLLVQELQAYMYAQADARCVFVQWQDWLSIHLGETEASVIDVAGIAANLGLGHPDCRESMRFDFDPMWEEIECQADDIGALAK